jgi:membrane protein implicated in regulation of membrane protease activity
MDAISPRTVALDSKGLDAAIAALSDAVDTFRLTPFERRSFRVLVVSVDLAVVSLLCVLGGLFSGAEEESSMWHWPFGASALVFAASIVVAVVALALNLPLFRKISRENSRLKELGLGALSQSLWEAGRRRQWVSRGRGALLVLLGGAALVIATLGLLVSERGPQDAIYILFFALVAALLFATRYIRNQRERTEVVSDAVALREALENLRQRAGETKAVRVPSQLLERAANIESVQIAKERRDALLQSAGDRPTGYAVTFETDAAAQRSALGVRERTDLEDLVARLSTGDEFAPASAPDRTDASTTRLATEGRVQAEFTLDAAARSIRIGQVRLLGDTAPQSLSGSSHA